jgi:hypothetical protein
MALADASVAQAGRNRQSVLEQRSRRDVSFNRGKKIGLR